MLYYTDSQNLKSLSGLSESEAESLLAKFGPNTLESKHSWKTAKMILSLLLNPILVILLVASALTALLGQTRDGIVILSMVILSLVLDFYQEYKSDKAESLLSKKLNRNCTVLRGGKQVDLSVEKIVPGDIILTSIGDIVPADSIVLGQNDSLSLNESSITGESLPVEKKENDKVFAGTNVVSGWSWIKVTKTGKDTSLGNIASNLDNTQVNAFERGATDFSWLIFKSTISIIAVILCINFIKIVIDREFNYTSVFEIILFAVSITVGLAPELLPVIMSVNKTRGAVAMSKQGVLVKKLDAIPNLGSMDILCTDKTGTLTENKIKLIKYLDLTGSESNEVLNKGYLNSIFQTGLKNPLDEAIVEHMHDPSIDGKFKKVDEIPYDFNRKRLSVLVQEIASNKTMIICKGQYKSILSICKYAEGSSNVLDKNIIQSLDKIYDSLSAQGFRVIALACRDVNKDENIINNDSENGMTFCGFLAFLDPPKMSSASAIFKLEKYKISIKVITGDNELVTRKVSNELNLTITGLITGNDLDKLESKQFLKAIEDNNIFTDCNPGQKKKIIAGLRSNGHIVGYLGDGINDAPSLKESDVGISVDNAVDIARESADMILLNNDLNILLEGVIEGRKTFENTIKYMMMAISSNFGNMLSMIAAAIFLPFLPMLPVQILLNNSLYDLSQLAIPTDNVDEENLENPQRWNIGNIKRFMIIFGLISSGFDLFTFYMLLNYFHVSEHVFQTVWFIISISTQILVIYIIRTRKIPIIQSRPSKWLVINTLITFCLAWAIPFGLLGQDFMLVPLNQNLIVFSVLVVVAYLITTNIIKNILQKKYKFGETAKI